MSGWFRPPQASTMAQGVDALMLFLLLASIAITIAIFVCITVFCIRYRRRPGRDVGERISSTPVEIAWTIVPAMLAMIPFVWGAQLYLQQAQPPSDAMEVYVVAKQWMWKTQQPDGQTEINALHVPTGRAVKLTMTSQDVIHSFSVPAFRLRGDVLPGRFTTLWFQATTAGDYPLYCSEYCGTDHARMLGTISALAPGDYATWLERGATAGNSPAARGAQVFRQYGCIECHEANRAPNLSGVYGSRVALSDGSTIVADENYIRESIESPTAKVVFGYQPIMPSFANVISDDEMVELIAYVKSLGAAQ